MYSVTTAAVTREQITMAEKTNRGTRKANLTKGTGALKVRGCNFYVRSADKTQFAARVHWAPAFIPNAAIAKVLGESCKVQSIAMETSTCKGFEGIPTGIRQLVLTGVKDEILHVFTIVNPKTEEKFELLITIPGRSPLCFKCKHTGHYRSECFTPPQTMRGIWSFHREMCHGKLVFECASWFSSTAEASIDEDIQYAYRDGGVEQVKVGSGRRVAASGSSTGDLDTRSAGTNDVPMYAAERAGCGFPPAADVAPLDPAAHVARDDSIPAEADERSAQPVEDKSTQTVSRPNPSISTREAAVAESVSAWCRKSLT